MTPNVTTRAPYHSGNCECGRPPGQCVKGDLEMCPTVTDFENEDDDCERLDEWDDDNL